MDYFGARYSDSVVGRFISVDPLLDRADLSDPQSWNRYTYVGNNPLRFVDPFGEQKQDATKRTKEQVREALRSFCGDDAACQMISGVLLDVGFPDSNEELALAALGPLGKGSKLLKAGKVERIRELGRLGESLAGITGDLKIRIDSLTGTAKFRIPDELDLVAETLREVKNRGKVSLTAQIRDFVLFAEREGLQVILEVRKGAKLSQPLQDLVDEGKIILRDIPGT